MIISVALLLLDEMRCMRVRSTVFYDNVVCVYSDEEFQHHFRIPKAAFEEILIAIQNSFQMTVDVRRATLAAIWYLASGSCYRTVAALFGFPKSTFCNIVHLICKLVCQAYPDIVSYNKDLRRVYLCRLLSNPES